MSTFRKLAYALLLVLVAVPAFALAAGAPPANAQPAGSAPAAAAAPAAPTVARRGALTGTPTLASVERSGTLRVGIALNAPFVMHDKRGQPIGYSVDVAKQLAASMGWKLKLVETSWPNLLAGLRSNEYDVVIAGVSITPQRALGVLFSQPTGEFDVDVVANRAKFPSGGVAELAKLANAKIGARKGELTLDFARSAFPASSVVSVDSESAALADVVSGKLDAYVAEAPLPQVAAEVHADKLRVVGGAPLARTAHGIAMRIGDASLMRVVNAWITYEQASGWLKGRDDYWFKGTTWGADL